LLKVFEKVANVVSGSKYHTSNLYFYEMWSVKKVLDKKTSSQNQIIAFMVTEIDEDMTPSDTTIAYKVSLVLLFHSDFWHNSLDSTCTYHYLLVGANISQSASPPKLLCHCHGLVIHNWDLGPS